MKYSIFLLAIFSFTIINCNDRSNPVVSDDGSFIISGKIHEFNGHFNKINVLSYPYADTSQTISADINSDGSFNLEIPVPDKAHLSSYTPFNLISIFNGDSTILKDNIIIADTGFKYIRYDLSVQSTSPITYSLPINPAKLTTSTWLAEPGDYFISFYYFNVQTSINGHYKWKTVTSDSSKEVITNFNIATKQGWNKIITTFVSKTENTSLYNIANTDEIQGDWIISASDWFPVTVRRL